MDAPNDTGGDRVLSQITVGAPAGQNAAAEIPAIQQAVELSVLLAGGIAASAVRREVAPALAAREAAERLLAPR